MDPLIILVVEDDETTRRALVRLLSRDRRVSTLEASDGLEALEILERQPVDMVISDEVMPRMNGLRLLETVRGRWPGTRRALYTGYTNPEIVLAAINRGGVEKALSKGMMPEEFRAELGELIEEALAQRLNGSGSAVSSLPAPPDRASDADSPSVLIASDELAMRQAIQDVLSVQCSVRATATDRVVTALQEGSTDVVVLDLSGGMANPRESLLGIRSVDLDCPVIVLVPRSGIGAAHEAMELGAHRYLVHPVPRDALARVIAKAASFKRLSRARRAAAAHNAESEGGPGDRAGLEVRFHNAIEQLFMVYQPIIRWSRQQVMGYEALVRSAEPSMPHPGLLLDAAARLGQMPRLSARIREIAPTPFLRGHDDTWLFLNVHVSDLGSRDFLESSLVEISDRVVLEVTERAALDSVSDLRGSVSNLRASGYRIAVDDLGAGYAGLSSFATLDPDIVKLDMSLTRDIHESPTKQRLVESLQRACADLGTPLVVEGVESIQERDALVAVGCDIFQGYLFGRPAREILPAEWR